MKVRCLIQIIILNKYCKFIYHIGDGKTVNKKNIKYLIMDVDGTLTDGMIYMGENGEVMKAFSIKDGCGISNILIPNDILPVIITGRKSNILLNRCKELGIKEIYQNVKNKDEKLKEIINDYSQIAYIGDDINDLSCMKLIKEAGGIIGCPQDAVEDVKKIADFIALNRGGKGAVREFIEWLVYDKTVV